VDVVLLDAIVDRALCQQRRRERRGRAEQQREQHRRDAQAIGAQQLQQATQVAPATFTALALAIPSLSAARETRPEAAACAAAPAAKAAAHRPARAHSRPPPSASALAPAASTRSPAITLGVCVEAVPDAISR
jgi:hypothetical protein